MIKKIILLLMALSAGLAAPAQTQTLTITTSPVSLVWSPLVVPAGFNPATYTIGSGLAPGNFTNIVFAGTNAAITVSNLPPGTNYFAVMATAGAQMSGWSTNNVSANVVWVIPAPGGLNATTVIIVH